MIKKYASLIEQLPVRNIAFQTKRTTWESDDIPNPNWLIKRNEELFKNGQLQVSRHDVFNNNQDIEKLILLTYFWGYSNGTRGNFFKMLPYIDTLKNALIALKRIDNPTTNDFRNFLTSIKNIKGLGISTYTKFLYFLEIKINGYECLIIDQRLIDSFSNECFSQFEFLRGITSRELAEANYPEIIEELARISLEFGFKAENLEMFLFTFGKNLRPINIF